MSSIVSGESAFKDRHPGGPFLLRFRKPLPGIDPAQLEEFGYSDKLQKNLTASGEVAWHAGGRSQKPYTSTYTAGHFIQGGFTPSGKYRQGKSVPAKTDKRAGK
jgi:hypothetical protein